MPEGSGPRSFRLLGPFPNAPADEGGSRTGLDHDYLGSLGGEAQARIDEGTKVLFEGRTITSRPATLDRASVLDFHKSFGGATDTMTGYAYAEWNAEAPGRYLAVFGSDDGAAIWINGTRVHRAAVDRGLIADSDSFAVTLAAGINRILVKVDNGEGAWAFALRVLDAPARERFASFEARRHLESVEAAPVDGGYLLDETFPDIAWRDRATAADVFADASPEVRWYGPDLAPAERPAAMGQYTAVVGARTRDGFAFREMLAFAKANADILPKFPSPPTHELPVVEAEWPFGAHWSEPRRAELSRYFWAGAASTLKDGRNAAVAALALSKIERAPSSTEPLWLSSGFIQVAEKELALRIALEGRKVVELPPPQGLATPAPELHAGSEAQAGMRPGTARAIRAVADEWAKADDHPFVVLVARRGVVFFHEAFHGFRKDSTFYPASIGKTIAALTFARAVDHGLLGFDQPVGDVLTDWKDDRTRDVTFRNCFNHVTGLSGHASHGGMFNAYLDNALFVEDEAFSKPRASFRYNGDDMDLAGKALELVTGRAIWRLLYEGMIQPFGEPVHQLDLGFGGAFTAMYLAEVGQMVLQDGAYGHHRFFRPGFLASLRPRRIVDSAPELDDPSAEAGIGLAWMIDPHGPRGNGVLGPNVIGHGASSGATWRIDPDHEIVVVVGRDGFKDAQTEERWQTKLVSAVAAGITP
jgi:CubicO group peptidase (beta-lactamase class C family)